jgi:hypothetical protein
MITTQEHEHFAETAPAGQWRGVFFDGPQADQNQDGDEVPVWCVYVGDEEAHPLHRVYWCWSYAFALDLAQRIARDRRLELIHEAATA